ncbi:hypothetical protein ACI3EJ_02270 [Ligilactobacillus acidipiscis]|uniref:hypothetical protein n=1 Tax=Ligilactobacillus acidipiscis TaxID=89059 RepID=UPI0038632E2D
MKNENDFVQIKVADRNSTKSVPPTKAFQMRINDQKTIVVYNRIQSYILDALLKAVLRDDA